MAVFPRDVKDRVVQTPTRYQLVPVGGTTDKFDLVPVPGTVTEAGTALNKAYLQPIEQGLYLMNTVFPLAGTNAYTVTISGVAALSDLTGIPLKVKVSVDSTGTITVNPNGLGAIPVKKASLDAAEDWKANGIITIVYDGSSNFISQGEGGGNANIDLIKDYTIGSGQTLALGNGAGIKNDQLIKCARTAKTSPAATCVATGINLSNAVNVGKIDDTHFLVIYNTTGSDSYIAIGTLNDDATLTIGTPYHIINTTDGMARLSSMEAVRLRDGYIGVIVRTWYNAYNTRFFVIKYSGTTVTGYFGVYSMGDTYSPGIVRINDYVAAIVSVSTNNVLFVVVRDNGNDTITAESPQLCLYTGSGLQNAEKVHMYLRPDGRTIDFIAGLSDYYYWYHVVIGINPDTLVATIIKQNNTCWYAQGSQSDVAEVYSDSSCRVLLMVTYDNKMRVAKINYTANTITLSSADVAWDTESTYYPRLAVMSGYKRLKVLLLGAALNATDFKAFVVTINVTNLSVSFSTKTSLTAVASSLNLTSAISMNAGRALFSYVESTYKQYLKQADGLLGTPSFTTLQDFPKPRGLIKAGGSAGGTGKILFKGILNGLSGLIPSTLYGIDDNGLLSASGYYFVGLALSSSELLLLNDTFNNSSNGQLIKKTLTGTATIGKVVKLNTDGTISDYDGTSYPIGVYIGTNTVILKGVVTGLSGLTPFARYYYNSSGVISTNSSGVYLGQALSTTSLVIENYLPTVY